MLMTKGNQALTSDLMVEKEREIGRWMMSVIVVMMLMMMLLVTVTINVMCVVVSVLQGR